MALSHCFKPLPLSVGQFRLTGRANIGIPDVHRVRDAGDDLFAVYLYQDAATRPEEMERLRVAFEAAAVLEHPNILRVIDWGREGSFGYIATEWVDGATLARMLELHARLPEANVVRYLAQVGQALDFARRDDRAPCRVTPATVLIRADGHAKVIPFELPAEEAPPPVTTPAPLKGWGNPQATWEKPQPEERALRHDPEAGRPVPFAEAVFALGTTLHEALTGAAWQPPAPPRPGRRRKPPPPRSAGLSDRTERAIRRATDPDPARRPASCAEFIRMLRPRPLTAGTPKSDTRPAGSSGTNRRGYIRYALGVGTNCTISSSVFDDERPSSEIWPLVVQDVSLTGIGVLLARRCEPGTILSVEVAGPGAGRSSRSLPVQVVRVRKDNFGHWAHGCMFLTPLDERELHTLLDHLGRDGA